MAGSGTNGAGENDRALIPVPRLAKVPAQDSEFLTDAQGHRIEHTDDSLKAGARGPTLMEDFHFREKIT
ncbi:MAG TPA: hypothetical protein VGI86_02475, partial [Acidimicrobiia bacterium]